MPEPSTSWLSVRSAATYLDCSVHSVRRHIRAGRIPAYRVADQQSLRLKIADLDALMVPAASK